MIRKIIEIDHDRCNGCGLCARACKEAAIAIRDGKAVLIRDDYCDGLGNCLPACPMDAISFVEREAAAYNEAAVQAHIASSSGCPGSRARTMEHPVHGDQPGAIASHLRQWPVQIKLISPAAPFFRGADVLVAADCTAYAYGDFHRDFMDGKVTLIGCPKLDETDYADKLTDIFSRNDIASVTVARMEVPCCGGMERAVKEAIRRSDREIPCHVVIISTDGRILSSI